MFRGAPGCPKQAGRMCKNHDEPGKITKGKDVQRRPDRKLKPGKRHKWMVCDNPPNAAAPYEGLEP